MLAVNCLQMHSSMYASVPRGAAPGGKRRNLPSAFPQATPRFASLTELHAHRKKTKRPHDTFDLNGDGQIGQREYFLATRFDTNRNGILEPEEVAKAAHAFSQGFGADDFRQYFSCNNLHLTRFDRVMQKTCRVEPGTFEDTFNRTITDYDTRNSNFEPGEGGLIGAPPAPPLNTQRHMLTERRKNSKSSSSQPAGVGSDEPALCHARQPHLLKAEQKKPPVRTADPGQPSDEATRFGFREKPDHKTTSELVRRRKEALVPHSSYDLDGDGVVAPRDYFIAKMFDKGNKHALSAEERSAAHAAIAEGLGKDSMEHYFTHRSTTAQPHKPPLTRTDKVFHKTFRVKPTHLSHTHERVIGNWESRNEEMETMTWSSTQQESMKQVFGGGQVKEIYTRDGVPVKQQARPHTPHDQRLAPVCTHRSSGTTSSSAAAPSDCLDDKALIVRLEPLP